MHIDAVVLLFHDYVFFFMLAMLFLSLSTILTTTHASWFLSPPMTLAYPFRFLRSICSRIVYTLSRTTLYMLLAFIAFVTLFRSGIPPASSRFVALTLGCERIV